MKKRYTIAMLNEMLGGGLDVYTHYLGENIRVNHNLCSPFRKERHASFRLYPHKSGNGAIFFTDHGTGVFGNHWVFAALMNGLDPKTQFQEAVSVVKRDILHIYDEEEMQPVLRTPYVPPLKRPSVVQEPVLLETTARDWTDADRLYWNEFNISQQTLTLFRAQAVARFTIRKGNWQKTVMQRPENPIYCFHFEQERKKIYRPLATDRRDKWLSNVKGNEDLFGFHLLPHHSKNLFLTAGQKDTMSFYQTTGQPCVALNSETANLNKIILSVLYTIADNLYTVYDNDKTGKLATDKLYQEFGIASRNAPITQPGFDFAKTIQHHRGDAAYLNAIQRYYAMV